jgi:hypothetical protein
LKNRISKLLVLCFVLIFTGITINPSISFACKCVGPSSVKEEFERSNAVFSGKVNEIKEKKQSNGYPVKSILFDVKNTWKGVSESQIIIVTDQSDCGYEFRKGEEYLVYANHSSLYGDKDNLSTGICDLTSPLGEADNDLLILGEGKTPSKVVDLQKEFNRSGVNTFIWVWVIIIGIIGFVAFLFLKRLKK